MALHDNARVRHPILAVVAIANKPFVTQIDIPYPTISNKYTFPVNLPVRSPSRLLRIARAKIPRVIHWNILSGIRAYF